MVRLWVKLIQDNKIQKDLIYESFTSLSYASFYDCLVEICHKLDISTPILIPTHYDYYCEFNMVKFLPRDFVDSVSFDSMVIENALV